MTDVVDEPPAKVRPDRVSERAAGKQARERRRARRVGRRQVARHRARRRHRLLRQPDRQPAREQQQQRPVCDAGTGDCIAHGGAGKREQQHQLAAARVREAAASDRADDLADAVRRLEAADVLAGAAERAKVVRQHSAHRADRAVVDEREELREAQDARGGQRRYSGAGLCGLRLCGARCLLLLRCTGERLLGQ